MTFSVIIPVYNVGRLLADCLKSVISAASAAKMEAEVECICVDDGSTDESGSILDDFARVSPVIRVVHRANAGVSVARNCGLERASGDWLLFLDADDVIRETLFSDLASAAAECPSVDLLAYGMTPFYEERVCWPNDAVQWTDAGIADALDNVLAARSFCQFAYRRREHGQARFRGLRVGEDIVFCVEALVRSHHCVVNTRSEYGYRFRADSATHARFTPEKMLDVISFHTAEFRALAASGKRVGSGFWRGRGNVWIEDLPRDLLRKWRGPDFERLWTAWVESMAVAAEVPCLSRGQRFAARCVARTGSIWVCRLVCLIPAWLARKGLLRRRPREMV